MKKTIGISAAVFALALAWGGLRAAQTAPDSADDTVALKDGRVLHGTVIEESKDDIVVMVDGVKRSFGRSFVTKVTYGNGSGEGSAMASGSAGAPMEAPGAAHPAPPAGTIPTQPPKGDLVADISTRYKVPPSDVVWVRQQGIADADVPLVFLIAATAGVVPRAVVSLRMQGWAWADIEAHFGMRSDYIYYEPGPWVAYPYYYPAVVGLGWWGLGWGWGGHWGGHWGGGWGGHWR
jgi:hypothetical protein